MPYTVEVIDNGKGIQHVGSGIVSGGDLMTSAATVLKMVHEGLTPEYAVTDLTHVTDFSVSAEEIARNAALNNEVARRLPRVKVAIIAPADNIFGMARMWQAHMDGSGWVSKVFRNRADALTWLKQSAKPGPNGE